MATVTHYIRSDYDPEVDRERLLRETRQPPDEPNSAQDADLAWQAESSSGVNRRIVLAPRFVPATHSHDEWGNVTAPVHEAYASSHASKEDGISGWYRSLRRTDADKAPSTLAPPNPSPLSRPQTSAPSPLSTPPAAAFRPSPASNRPRERDWFISRALDHSTSLPSTPAPSSSLADILSRDPPASKPHKPPVFLHLGPSNKGWAMLQNQGWSEGEPLGGSGGRPRKRARSTPALEDINRPESSAGSASRTDTDKPRPRPPSRASPAPKVKREELALDDDIVEVKHTPLIDLTLSDSDDDDGMVSDGSPSPGPPLDFDNDVSEPYSSTQTALLTPLPTVLKSDRLGIGLKAKTEGPYRSSVKRVTHNTAALAAHIKAAEEARRTKDTFGRGKHGFQRMERRERQERQDWIAYMNR